MAKSSTSFDEGNKAALQHGQRSLFARSGGADDTALSEPQLSRLAVLRADLDTPEGITAALRERAARMVMIAEWGESWLQAKAEAEGPTVAFESKMLARFFTAQAEARRALESLSKMQGTQRGQSLDDLLRGNDGD
jgi:hypothetical protein